MTPVSWLDTYLYINKQWGDQLVCVPKFLVLVQWCTKSRSLKVIITLNFNSITENISNMVEIITERDAKLTTLVKWSHSKLVETIIVSTTQISSLSAMMY
jgi:hypothetical protein